jgi:hypothetical protein
MRSLAYCFLHFVRGSLPWAEKDSRDVKRLARIKAKTTVDELCQNLEHPAQLFVKHCFSLEFSSTPNYQYLRDCICIHSIDKTDSEHIALHFYMRRWPVHFLLKSLGGAIQTNLPSPPDCDTISVWIIHQPESATLFKAFTLGEARVWEIREDPIWDKVPGGSTVSINIIFMIFNPFCVDLREYRICFTYYQEA